MLKFSKKRISRGKIKKDNIIHFGLGIIIVFIIQLNFIAVGSNFFNIISNSVSEVATVVSSVLALQTNEYRVTNLEKELVVSDVLTQAAQMKADDMAAKGYFSHVGPLGEEPWSWFDKIGYKYNYAGENLAVDFTESTDVTTGWINSATHKANLLNKNFTEIGIATAEGMFMGHKTTFVVQFFGTPISIKPTIIPTPVVLENNPVIVKPIVEKAVVMDLVSTTTSIDTIDPTIPVATSINTPNGQVLGTELSGYEQDTVAKNNYIKLFGILTVVILLILIISRIVAVSKKKKLIK